MDIKVNKEILKQLEQFKKAPKAFEERFNNYHKWGDDDDIFKIPIDLLTEDELEVLYKIAEKSDNKEIKTIVRKVNMYRNIKKDACGVEIKKLEALLEASQIVLRKLPNKWLFKEAYDGIVVPYYVSKIAYVSADRHTPAHVVFHLNYIERGRNQDTSISYYYTDLGSNISGLLAKKGYYVETQKLIDEYFKGVDTYKIIHRKTGHQYTAVGKAQINDNNWDSGTITMERDGESTKVVMDDIFDDEKDEDERTSIKAISNKFWHGKKLVTEEDDSGDDLNGDEIEDTEEAVIPPLHPYVKCFDLIKHRYITIHVENLKEYVYDTKMAEKLVLPKHKKDLVDILVQGTGSILDDIVKGKTGGIIVLATGTPGTGKTLTAEVYSEAVKKPLYVVQCSQLGITANDLEEKLTKVLSRAVRWGAILLIDEADVYVYERGNNIEQNAIVGVFLRVLEYFRGVLFLTSNRATIIDDAIISRITAHIVYDIPSEEEATRIWKVLSTQFKIKLSDDEIKKYVKAFPEVSGRTIKNLLKLSKLLADRENKPISLDLVKYAAIFLDGTKTKPESTPIPSFGKKQS